MNTRNNYKKYQKQFNEWVKQKLEDKDYMLQNRRGVGWETTEEELCSFQQCYTTDQKQKFYAARRELPKYWFISPCGTLISCYDETPHLVVPTISGGGTNRREQYEMPKGRVIDPAVLVALTFGGKATEQAEALIQKRGLKAFKHKPPRSNYVELHHIEGYMHGAEDEEIRELRAYNADIHRTMLAVAVEHDMITYMPSTEETVKDIECMKKASQIFPHDRITAVLQGEKRGTGEIFEDAKKIEDGKIEAGGKTFKILGVKDALLKLEVPKTKVSLRYADGKEAVRGEDIPKTDYDLRIQMAEEEFRKRPVPYVHFTEENGEEIYAVRENGGILV